MNDRAKRVSLKSRLELTISNLVEETRAQQASVHGTWYTRNSKNRSGRIYKYSYKNKDSILFVRKLDGVLDTTIYPKRKLNWLGDSSSYGGANNY